MQQSQFALTAVGGSDASTFLGPEAVPRLVSTRAIASRRRREAGSAVVAVVDGYEAVDADAAVSAVSTKVVSIL